MIRSILRRIAYRDFQCTDCIGMPGHGCYCYYHNASAPGVGPTRLQRLALWLLS